MNPQDLTGAVTRRGPIIRIQNGKGIRPWLEQVIVEPGWVYWVTKAVTHKTPAGPTWSVCWRCVHGVMEHFEAHTVLDYEAEPPKPDERCPRCERSFGARPAPE